MRGCSCKPLLLQLLFIHTITAVVFPTVLSDVAVHGPSLSLKLDKICECRAQCFVHSNCTAASYDKRTTECNMTHSAPKNVTLVPQNGVVALLKYELNDHSSTSLDTPSDPSQCPNDPPNGTVYVTNQKSRISRFWNQQEMCEEEGGGVPFVIKTQAQREAAATAVTGRGEKIAWLTATTGLDNVISWPDGSSLSGCAFQDKLGSITPFSTLGLTSSGIIKSNVNWFPLPNSPVLCLK